MDTIWTHLQRSPIKCRGMFKRFLPTSLKCHQHRFSLIFDFRGKLIETMEICKIVSENWTYMGYISHMISFWMLYTMVKTIFDKSQLWVRKSRFQVRTLKILVLKYSELVRDTIIICFANKYLGHEFCKEEDWCIVHV